MRLALTTDVMSAMGLNQLPDYINAVDEALETATEQLVNDLRTEFDRQSLVDYYDVGPGDPFTKLKLTQGFVRIDPSPVVIYALSPDAFADGDTIDITPQCVFDYDKGVVFVRNAPTNFDYRGLGGSSLSISYSAGFSPDVADADLYDQGQVPGWLQLIARLAARVSLSAHPALQVTGVTPDTKPLIAQYSGIVARKTRYVPSSIKPKICVPA